MFSHELCNTHKHPPRSNDRANFEDEETEAQCDLPSHEAGGRGEELRPSSENKPFKWPYGHWSPNPICCCVPGLMGIAERLRAMCRHIFAFGRSFPWLSLSLVYIYSPAGWGPLSRSGSPIPQSPALWPRSSQGPLSLTQLTRENQLLTLPLGGSGVCYTHSPCSLRPEVSVAECTATRAGG